MKQIKEAKNIEIFVNIRYEENEENLIQRFSFSATNKKYLNYLFDARFLFKRKVDKLINDFLLDGYISRIDSKDSIEMIYKKQEKPSNCIRKLQAYVPPYFGCKFCSLAKIDGDFIYCPEKNKHYTKVSGGVQRCPVFRTKEELIT